MIALPAAEGVLDASGIAPRIEAVLPSGARTRQLTVRTLLLGMMLALADGRPAHRLGSPGACRAWPLAWPSPSGPLGWQRSPGSTARRRRVPRSGMRSTVEAGGADPDNARRSVPCWWPSRRRRNSHEPRGRARHRADTAGTARGRSPGWLGRGSSARRRASARRARRKLPHHPTAHPRSDPGRLRRVTLAAHLPNWPRPLLAVQVQAVRLGAPKVRP